MPTFDYLVDLYLRDHEGYQADGHGGSGALPIGDTSTARKPIDKRDLREVLHAYGAVGQQAADAAAEAEAARDAAVAASTDVQGSTLYAADLDALLANTASSYTPGTVFGTRAGGTSYEVVAAGGDFVSAGGVHFVEAGPNFSSFGKLQAAVARGRSWADGTVVWAGGVPYIADAASSDPAPGIKRRLDGAYMRLLSLPYVDPTWLGMRPGASATVNALALADALQDGRQVNLPRGEMLCDPVGTTVATPNDVILRGAGANATVLNFGSDGGIHITIGGAAGQMQGDKVSVDVSGIGFRTESSNAHTALRVEVPDSGTGEAGTHVLRRLANLSFAGVGPSAHWGNGLHVTNGSYWNIDEIWGRGPETGKGGAIILIDGGMSSVDTHIGRVKGAHFAEGIVCIGRNEGLTIRDAILVHVNTGIRHHASLVAGETDQPWLQIAGCHINASGIGIDVDNVTQAQINSNLIYLDAANAIGVLMRRRGATVGVGSHQITANQIVSVQAAAAQVGIQMDAYTGQSVIANNRLNSIHDAIVMLANSNQNIGSGNLASNLSGQAIVDQGVNNAVTVTAF